MIALSTWSDVVLVTVVCLTVVFLITLWSIHDR